MGNFSNHHSLKRRFHCVLNVLVSAQIDREPVELTKLITGLIDDVITSDPNSLPKNSSPELKVIILGLYHHQDLVNLTEYFNQLQDELQCEYLVIALAIALCCRGEMQPRSFISKISNYLKPYPEFCAQLRLANSLAEKGESRAIARSVIAEDTLEYGLYCFLSTPYSGKLVNQGAGSFQISILAIAAAYLGYIPFEDVKLGNSKLGMDLGDRLLAAWAGVYDLTNIPNNFYPTIQFPERISLGA